MKKAVPFLMLFSRLLLFAAFQGLIALIFLFSGNDSPWNKSEGFWIISGLLTNILVFFILQKLYKAESSSYFDNLKFIRKKWWKDLLIAVGFLLLAIPITTFPNIFLARALFGSEEATLQLFIRPLPLWVVIIGFIWAVTQGLVELPTYFSYIMPRIEKQLKNGWIALLIVSLFLSLQHITIPLIFNQDFILWRLGMFIPFALFIGICIKIRPRLFPYLLVIHTLMDIMVVVMLLQASN